MRFACWRRAAGGELDDAITAIERARALAPGDPLVAWESALVYKGALEAGASVPRESILPDLISGRIEAPPTSIDTTYCDWLSARSCYVALDNYEQPYAELPNGPSVRQDVLFMYPPSSASITREIFASHPALQFLLALDPNLADSRSDGATFQVWLSSGGEDARLVYERTVDRARVAQGWIPDWVDLSRWAGQTVTLTLQTTGGPQRLYADDWYAWAQFNSPPSMPPGPSERRSTPGCWRPGAMPASTIPGWYSGATLLCWVHSLPWP